VINDDKAQRMQSYRLSSKTPQTVANLMKSSGYCYCKRAKDGWRHPDTTEYEEALVQLFQGFLCGGWEMTATSPDRDWWAIRQKAWALLGR
jgi:hypothetical protein